MRSNDVIFGYRNDWAWQDYVLRHLANDLSIDVGDIHWQVQNLHVYERHFGMVK
jgi:thymidylate synthase